MWLKIKFGLFSLILLTVMLFLSGCLEEPTIPPARDPYSVLRVVNLSNSASQIFIDNGQPVGSLNSVTVPFTTNYFDINAGKRTFIVKDAGQNTIFDAGIDVISYNREVIVFAGTYSNVLENNTFSSMKVSEGEIYVEAMPEAGKTHIVIANAFPGYYTSQDTINPISFALFGTYWSGAEGIDTGAVAPGFRDSAIVDYDDDLLKFGITYNIINTDPGSYKFDFMNATGETLSIADFSYYEAGKKYYLFVYGNPDVLSIYRNEYDNLPIRSIYEK